jgi:hypothetical protein
MRPVTLPILAAVAVVLSGLAACGGSSDDTGGAPPTSGAARTGAPALRNGTSGLLRAAAAYPHDLARCVTALSPGPPTDREFLSCSRSARRRYVAAVQRFDASLRAVSQRPRCGSVVSRLERALAALSSAYHSQFAADRAVVHDGVNASKRELNRSTRAGQSALRKLEAFRQIALAATSRCKP